MAWKSYLYYYTNISYIRVLAGRACAVAKPTRGEVKRARTDMRIDCSLARSLVPGFQLCDVSTAREREGERDRRFSHSLSLSWCSFFFSSFLSLFFIRGAWVVVTDDASAAGMDIFALYNLYVDFHTLCKFGIFIFVYICLSIARTVYGNWNVHG